MKIGVALGGGGAKGFAHLGVLKILAQAGIECEVVSGTSIGALVGATYAAASLEDFEKSCKKIKLTDIPILLTPTWPKQGLFSGKKVLDLLSELIKTENIEDLEKPFAAVCVDLNDGEIVTFTSGNLTQALKASMAIPGVFTPVVIEDKLLVDGGVLEPVPVWAARSLGAEFVIAVDLLAHSHRHKKNNKIRSGKRDEIEMPGPISVPDYLIKIWEKTYFGKQFNLKGKDKPYEPGILDIIQITSLVAQRGMTKYRLKEHPPDFIIRPEVADVGMFDFHRGDSIIKIGEESAKAVLPNLKEEITKHKSRRL